MVENSGTWYTTGFGNDVIAGVSVELSTNLSLEDNAIDNVAYPNPATTFINVPLSGVVGDGTLNILDLTEISKHNERQCEQHVNNRRFSTF